MKGWVGLVGWPTFYPRGRMGGKAWVESWLRVEKWLSGIWVQWVNVSESSAIRPQRAVLLNGCRCLSRPVSWSAWRRRSTSAFKGLDCHLFMISNAKRLHTWPSPGSQLSATESFYLVLLTYCLPTTGQISDACHRQSIVCRPSHAHISKTNQDRPMVTMEH